VEAHFADDPDFRRFLDLIAAEGTTPALRASATATCASMTSSTGRAAACSLLGRTSTDAPPQTLQGWPSTSRRAPDLTPQGRLGH
jgi:hypothetical protein